MKCPRCDYNVIAFIYRKECFKCLKCLYIWPEKESGTVVTVPDSLREKLKALIKSWSTEYNTGDYYDDIEVAEIETQRACAVQLEEVLNNDIR